ncbi:hypothetical protein, partial [Shigella sonnei]|uniref:hypothetical protein n=1 Tax=Shigella sonnei TaxID=624 RepID=UPI000B23006F
SRTRLYIKGNGIVDLPKLQEMVADVSHHFPLRLPAPTPKALYSPCEIRHLAIIAAAFIMTKAVFINQEEADFHTQRGGPAFQQAAFTL